MTSDTPPPLSTRVTRLLGIQYPIIQAGIVWTEGATLAVAVSQAGGLGVLGAGSMKPDLLREQIRKVKAGTERSFGVNIPLSRRDAAELNAVSTDEGVRIVITSSGHPVTFTSRLKDAECIVIHLVAAVKHARKAAEAGCDAVVAEGFEAGGHNGVDEITTLALVPQVVDAVSIPVIAAGGIADGRGMAAVFALGAEGVQVGTRFAATVESAAHERYKQLVLEARDGDTVFTLKGMMPVRLLKTPFAKRAQEAERRGAERPSSKRSSERSANGWGSSRETLRKGCSKPGRVRALSVSSSPQQRWSAQ